MIDIPAILLDILDDVSKYSKFSGYIAEDESIFDKDTMELMYYIPNDLGHFDRYKLQTVKDGSNILTKAFVELFYDTKINAFQYKTLGEFSVNLEDDEQARINFAHHLRKYI